MQVSDNARTVLERRYLKKQDGQVVETPEEMIQRVSANLAAVEKSYVPEKEEEVRAQFEKIMQNLEFVPNSPTLMNAGRDLQQLAACFVLPVEDSMESIFQTLKDTALIQKSGGGTGFSFSRLRPNSDRVRSTGGVASGPVSFLKCYNAATEAVKQGGTRRGANMGILRVDHPDILEFIQCKADNTEITNFNISVAITEEFMQAAEADETYPLVNPRSGETVEVLSAREVFGKIVEMAWKNGEPGIVFLDRINKANPTPHIGEIEATNPCGEQPLLPNESCNLGSLNLARFTVRDGNQWDLDWDHLAEVIDISVRFLDNVVDANSYPVKAIETMTKGNRKIGLGVMGFADLLIRLGLAYNSDEGVDFGRQVMEFIHSRAVAASQKLAEERGPFPHHPGSSWDKRGIAIRNATVTTIAPTGTISIIAGASSGVEPLFALAFTRNVMDDDKLLDVNPLFEEIMRERGLYSQELMERVAERGSIQGMDDIPEDLQKLFVTAHDISPEWHIRMQAAFQQFTDNAVSKTVNFPAKATQDDIRTVYELAYRLGCKGVTVYRSGSREGEVLTVGTKKKGQKAGSQPDHTVKHSPRKRPRVTRGQTERVKTGCGTLYVTINEDDKGICEIFTTIGKAGGCAAAFSEATARLMSLSLRSGVEPAQISRQMRGIRCPHPMWQDGKLTLSCPDAIANVIDRYIAERSAQPPLPFENGTAPSNPGPSPETIEAAPASEGWMGNTACPDCGGSRIKHEDGCDVCLDCGFSRCG